MANQLNLLLTYLLRVVLVIRAAMTSQVVVASIGSNTIFIETRQITKAKILGRLGPPLRSWSLVLRGELQVFHLCFCRITSVKVFLHEKAYESISGIDDTPSSPSPPFSSPMLSQSEAVTIFRSPRSTHRLIISKRANYLDQPHIRYAVLRTLWCLELTLNGCMQVRTSRTTWMNDSTGG